ncbi:MAG: NTP transferase domain-containing protein [Planctomycetes bacterium]|nr:NTP transferase domain-containing protein [Planctomycetota bacterium]
MTVKTTLETARGAGRRPTVGLILAAGKGTRMKFGGAKVLVPLAGKPLLDHVLDALEGLDLERAVAIVGHDRDAVRAVLGRRAVADVVQEEQLGTAHAVLCAAPALAGFDGDLLILSGDMPLVRPETLGRLLARHRTSGADLTLLTAEADDPTGLGRVVRDDAGAVRDVVEERDIASEAVRGSREVNLGVYAARAAALLAALRQVGNDNAQREYYLPDAVRLMRTGGAPVEAWCGAAPEEGLGVNSQHERARVEAVFRRRAVERLVDGGVVVTAPDLVFLEADVRVGPGTVIQPFTVIRLGATIGSGCEIGPFAEVGPAARIPDGARIAGRFPVA